LSGRADIATTFEVPIGAPSGPGAVARVVQAPPYTLVVYVDPAQPVAGKELRVTFTGPRSEAVTAKESSIGRYDAALPALESGRWTATIAIGAEAKGDYTFDVAR
ncbi:MAG: hypothetical protein HYS77_14275, partial [Candidatus Rokubacteria bacterium]|nr:hypothetical protein [Candidatus Rokubacteria bacterium]